MSFWDQIANPENQLTAEQAKNAGLLNQENVLKLAKLRSMMDNQSRLNGGPDGSGNGINWNPQSQFAQSPTATVMGQPGQQPQTGVPRTAEGLMGAGIPENQVGGLMTSGPSEAAARLAMLRQANPDAFMAADTTRAIMAPALEGMTPEQQRAFQLNPTEASKTYADRAFPAVPDKMRLIDGLNAAIEARGGANNPAAKPYVDALAEANIGVTNAKETSRHNLATEGAAQWIETKDAMNNPILINKVTQEVRRPDGSQVNTSESIDPVAKLIANYDLPPLTSVALLKPYGQAVMAKVAALNPDYAGDQFQVRKGAKASFASGKNGTLVRQANTATSHIMTLEALGNALDGGDVQAVNKIQNMLSNQLGGVPIASYEAAAKMVGDEVNKFISGGPGASADREDYSKSLSAAKSPAQREAVLNTIKGLMTGQLHSLRRQYETETKAKDFGDKLEPEVQDLLANPQFALGKNPTIAPAANPAVTPVQTITGDAAGQAAWDAMKPGTKYIDPTGKTRTKQ
jgi:hypothetical protein